MRSAVAKPNAIPSVFVRLAIWLVLVGATCLPAGAQKYYVTDVGISAGDQPFQSVSVNNNRLSPLHRQRTAITLLSMAKWATDLHLWLGRWRRPEEPE